MALQWLGAHFKATAQLSGSKNLENIFVEMLFSSKQRLIFAKSSLEALGERFKPLFDVERRVDCKKNTIDENSRNVL